MKRFDATLEREDKPVSQSASINPDRDFEERKLATDCIPFRELNASELSIRYLQVLRLAFAGAICGQPRNLGLAGAMAERLAGGSRRDLLMARMTGFAIALWSANREGLYILPAPCRCATRQEAAILALWQAFRRRDRDGFAGAVKYLAGDAEPDALVDLGSRIALDIELAATRQTATKAAGPSGLH